MSPRLRWIRIAALGAVVATGIGIFWGEPNSIASKPALEHRLAGGLESRDALVSGFLAALEKKDSAALTSLRASFEEYRDVIIPGTVEPGRPPAMIRMEGRTLFADMMEMKSRLYTQDLLNRLGGRRWKLERVEFEKGTEDFLWFRAYRRTVLHVVAEDGSKEEIHTGSIVEENGRFKFASYVGD